MLFPIADALTVNTNRSPTSPKRPVRQLRFVKYLHNFRIVQ